MSAHRFKFEIGGETLHGLAFGSEAELEGFLAGRTVQIESENRTPQPPESEPRPPGRPSKAHVIQQAIAALGSALNPRQKLSTRIRLVQRHLAETVSDPSDIPAARTIREYLGENSGGNSGEKVRRAKMPRTGGV